MAIRGHHIHFPGVSETVVDEVLGTRFEVETRKYRGAVSNADVGYLGPRMDVAMEGWWSLFPGGHRR